MKKSNKKDKLKDLLKNIEDSKILIAEVDQKLNEYDNEKHEIARQNFEEWNKKVYDPVHKSVLLSVNSTPRPTGSISSSQSMTGMIFDNISVTKI
jgi:hypothetical protein